VPYANGLEPLIYHRVAIVQPVFFFKNMLKTYHIFIARREANNYKETKIQLRTTDTRATSSSITSDLATYLGAIDPARSIKGKQIFFNIALFLSICRIRIRLQQI
jgi:hypothetical protein